MSKRQQAMQARVRNPNLHAAKEPRKAKAQGPDGSEEPCYTSPRRKPIRRNARGQCRRGAVAYREIQDLQDSTHLLVPRTPMDELVRDILVNDFKIHDFEITRTAQQAREATHTIAESYMTDYLSNVNLCANHAGRQTIKPKDIDLMQKLLGEKRRK